MNVLLAVTSAPDSGSSARACAPPTFRTTPVKESPSGARSGMAFGMGRGIVRVGHNNVVRLGDHNRVVVVPMMPRVLGNVDIIKAFVGAHDGKPTAEAKDEQRQTEDKQR